MGIKMTPKRVDPLEPLRKLFPEGWTLAAHSRTERSNECLL